ncbi:MAG: galactokinase [Flavobacteriales bacterium]|nr:galactokinase [Flavobacteriales bacterium]
MDKLSTRFGELFGEEVSAQRYFCPGRVNLIGEHVDYLGGLVMPAAISLGITALILPTKSSKIRIHSTVFNETIEFNLDSLPTVKQKHWSDFILGVIIHLKQKGIQFGGCNILIDSNLPKGSGLSSSAALEVLCYFMFHSVFAGTEPDKTQMALDCQKIENEFVGLNCGIMDQFAVANGKENHAIVLNCNSLEHEFVPLELGEHSLLIINNNKPRTLAESAYNQRRKECNEAMKIISNHRQLKNLVEATLDDLKLISDPTLKKRTRHAITEQLRVQDSVTALSSGNLLAFGKLMNESHASLRDDYEVSCSELDFIVAELQSNPACLGARMTGAGFGGCCIALVDGSSIQRITQSLSETYEIQFKISPSFYDCKPSRGVHRIT